MRSYFSRSHIFDPESNPEGITALWKLDNPSEQSNHEHYFANFEDVILAYQQTLVNLHTFIWVKFNGELEEEIDTNNCIQSKLNNQIIYTSDNIQLKKDINNNSVIKYIRTTPGRILLNEVFHLNNQ